MRGGCPDGAFSHSSFDQSQDGSTRKRTEFQLKIVVGYSISRSLHSKVDDFQNNQINK